MYITCHNIKDFTKKANVMLTLLLLASGLSSLLAFEFFEYKSVKETDQENRVISTTASVTEIAIIPLFKHDRF